MFYFPFFLKLLMLLLLVLCDSCCDIVCRSNLLCSRGALKMKFTQVRNRTWEKYAKKAFFALCVVFLVVSPSLHYLNLKSVLEGKAPPPSIKAKEPRGPRVLLYITTHMSPQHEALLEGCWPYTIANSKLVRMADVTVFLNGDQERRNYNEALLRQVFYGKNITVHHSLNIGYQNGAIAAMAEGDKQGWFQGYDWVVRVNPDVIIRNDTYILSTIPDAEVDGIFVDCYEVCKGATHCNDTGYLIHSDFIAFRPSVIPRDIFWNESNDATGEGNAEGMNNRTFASVVRLGRDRWLPGATPQPLRQCRVSMEEHSPVAHYTPIPEGAHAQQCIDWYQQRGMTNISYFKS